MSPSKAEKEAFVSGLGGTTVEEINLISAVGTAGFLLRCSLLISSPALYDRACKQPFFSLLFDFSTIILPCVLVFTIMADYAGWMLVVEFATSLVLLIRTYLKSKNYPLRKILETPFPKRQPYLTVIRTTTNLFSAIGILAVDFHIFPRRLAKTETFGAGLMDIGVGSFMMAHGVTSLEAREQKRRGPPFEGYMELIKTTIKGVLPLFLVGLARTLLLKSTGYQEHVTEYGVHWNFFITVAAVRLLCSLLRPLLVCLPYGYGLIAVVLTILYQVLLQQNGLESYILLGPNGDGSRRGVVSANREGLVSCIGYFVIYIGWVQIGKWLFTPRKALKDYFVVLFVLSTFSVSLWIATNWFSEAIHPISRRMVNMPYIMWMFSYGAFIMSLYLTYDLIILISSRVTQSPAPPLYALDHTPDATATVKTTRRAPPPPPVPQCLVSAVDYNQLPFFLLANVLTGVVNSLVDTLSAGPVVALLVVCCYMAALQVIATILHSNKIKIKL